MTEHLPRAADGRGVEPVQTPSLAELIALTRRLHALEGRHTNQVNGHTVRVGCPPGETHCFIGTPERLAATAAAMRARIAALTGGVPDTRSAAYREDRRELLNRWHADDQSASVEEHAGGSDRSRP